MLVALHSWSADYRQKESVIYGEWATANDWVLIHPNFRGPNTKPQATGSELVIGDVLSAIDYAKANARVDESRIYAVGWSGGGYLGTEASVRWIEPTKETITIAIDQGATDMSQRSLLKEIIK